MHTLYICTTCKKRQGEDIINPLVGEQLYDAVTKAMEGSDLSPCVVVKPQKCLSGCKRASVIALTSPEKYSYVFGDLDEGDADTVLEITQTYVQQEEGVLKKPDRPEKLRQSVLARVPPFMNSLQSGDQ